MNAITTIDDPRYVKAMSHPLRVRILAILDERTANPVELAGWLGRQPRDRRLPRAHARAQRVSRALALQEVERGAVEGFGVLV
jgi:hypothetical protein